MSSTDFADAQDVLVRDVDVLVKMSGPGGSFPALNGSKGFAFGPGSLNGTGGAWAMHHTSAQFSPMPRGGSIRGCMVQVAHGHAQPGAAPFLFIGCGAAGPVASTLATGWLLGLADAGDGAAHIVLARSAPSAGLLDRAPGIGGIVARSSVVVARGSWCQLRLDVHDQGGDLHVRCYASDLNKHSAAAPVWTSIPGMEDEVVDAPLGDRMYSGVGASIRSGAVGACAGFYGVSATRDGP